jgi:hypothetical protein
MTVQQGTISSPRPARVRIRMSIVESSALSLTVQPHVEKKMRPKGLSVFNHLFGSAGHGCYINDIGNKGYENDNV